MGQEKFSEDRNAGQIDVKARVSRYPVMPLKKFQTQKRNTLTSMFKR